MDAQRCGNFQMKTESIQLWPERPISALLVNVPHKKSAKRLAIFVFKKSIDVGGALTRNGASSTKALTIANRLISFVRALSNSRVDDGSR
jgi:hypothetical protein